MSLNVKYKIREIVPLFNPKNLIFGKFDEVTLIFEDGLSKKMDFWTKSAQL